MSIVVAALRTLYVFTRRSTLLINSRQEVKEQLKILLVSLAEVRIFFAFKSIKNPCLQSWGGRPAGVAFDQCVKDDQPTDGQKEKFEDMIQRRQSRITTAEALLPIAYESGIQGVQHKLASISVRCPDIFKVAFRGARDFWARSPERGRPRTRVSIRSFPPPLKGVRAPL